MSSLFNPFYRQQSPQFHWWQGASGIWYIHTVYPLSEWPRFVWQNYIVARRESDGLVSALYIGQTGDGEHRPPTHEKLIPAIVLGATHVHVHLLAMSRQHRLDVET